MCVIVSNCMIYIWQTGTVTIYLHIEMGTKGSSTQEYMLLSSGRLHWLILGMILLSAFGIWISILFKGDSNYLPPT